MKKLAGKTILVVDDESDLREILCEEFEALGATVLCAENGSKAFDLFNSHSIDLIVSDVRMPGGDGVDLLKKVRARYPFAPPHVFLITGFADVTSHQALALGAQGMISKPFSLVQLRSIVTDCLLKASA